MTYARIRPLFFAAFLTFLPAVFVVAPATAQTQPAPPAKPTPKDPRIGVLIDMLGKTRTPSQAAISPDGTTVAWSLRAHSGYQIHLTEVANPDPAKQKTITTATMSPGCGSSGPVRR